MGKIKSIRNSILTTIKEIWFYINNFLKETGRNFLSKKVLDNLLFYTIIILLIISVLYAIYQLFYEIKEKFFEKQTNDSFPFVLEFSEHIFLYFLPIFILFGLLNYYKLEWRRLIDGTNKPNPNAQNSLNLSKKLFFSSILSYTSLKIIENLFFKYDDKVQNQMIYIGIFFLMLIAFVLIQHHQNKSGGEEK